MVLVGLILPSSLILYLFELRKDYRRLGTYSNLFIIDIIAMIIAAPHIG